MPTIVPNSGNVLRIGSMCCDRRTIMSGLRVEVGNFDSHRTFGGKLALVTEGRI